MLAIKFPTTNELKALFSESTPFRYAILKSIKAILMILFFLVFLTLSFSSWFTKPADYYIHTAEIISFINFIIFWIVIIMRRRKMEIYVKPEYGKILFVWILETIVIGVYFHFVDTAWIACLSAAMALFVYWMATILMTEQAIEWEHPQMRE